jgi:hypothetical protein
MSESDMCNAIATSAVQRVNDYMNHRTSWIKDLWNATTGLGLEHYAPGSTSFADVITGHLNPTIAVGVMALYWNQYNCANEQVEAGPFYLSNSHSSGHMVCTTQSGWEISFDGGATWYPISVKVCQLEA